MALPRLKEVVKLSELASKVYRRLEPQEYVGRLAPSLGMILQKDLNIANVEISEEFLDPITFLTTTYFRKPLVNALKSVNTSLQSTSNVVPVLSLTHAMGLGKTHFLTLLYHLYTKVPAMWSSVEEGLPEESDLLAEKASYRIDTAKRTLVIAIDLKYIPSELSPYKALFLTLEKIFEKYKRSVLEVEVSRDKLQSFKKLLSKIDEYEPKDAARKFVETLSELAVNIPILIIIDEIYAAVFEAIAGASGDYINSVRKVLLFLTSLIDELSGKFPAVLVYASAEQDVQRWRNVAGLPVDIDEKKWLKEAVKYFEERTSRLAPINVAGVSEEDALEIVKKRIARLEVSIDRALSDSATEKIRRLLSEIVGDPEASWFVNELRRTYPFSPMYRELVRKLITPAYSADFALGKLQHLRDLIKISSTVLGRALESDEDTYLISIAHVEHDDIKHLLDEGYANEWRRNVLSWNNFLELVKAETGNYDLFKMIKGAISSIYLKSVTNNAWDLILMMTKRPDTLSLDELDRRALSQRRLILSLVGVVDIAKLNRYHDVLERLSTTPYIHIVERNEGKYYYASLFENPYQLLREIRENEIRGLRDEKGRLKARDAIDYVRKKLEEYALVSEFKQRAHLGMELVGAGDFEEINAKFTEYLNKDEFTILVISPIDMANKLLVEEKKFEDVLESIRKSISKNANKIKYLNMFAVIVPYIDEDALGRLVNSLAEIKASEMVVNMLKSDRNMSYFAERAKESRKSLLDLIGKPEEEFKRIVMEIITQFRERLEAFAQQLSNSAVQNFTSDFIGLFRKIVAFNPSTGKIDIYDLAVSIDRQPQTLSTVFASLPIWIANAVKGKLQVVGAGEISARIVEWIKNLINIDIVREKLRKEREYRYSISSIVEAFVKGWPDIPLKPESVNSIKSAVEKLLHGRTIQTDHKDFKLIEIYVEEDHLIIRPKEVIPPPPPPPRGITGFEVSGVDNINIVLGSVPQIAQQVKMMRVEIQIGSDAEVSIRGPPAKIMELTKDLIKYLNRHRNEITSSKLVIELARVHEMNAASQMVKDMGLSPSKVRFLESRE